MPPKPKTLPPTHSMRLPDATASHGGGGAPVPSSLCAFFASLTELAQPYASEHARFDEYQRTLPVRTVVPEPPNTMRDFLRHQLWRAGRALFLFLFFAVSWPILLIVHLVLLFLDAHQRRLWLQHQRSWPFKSVPHVRANTHPPSEEFPMEAWHLRCEDGRQRWYHGAPLEKGESDNELGFAQLCGLNSVDEYRELLRQRAQSGVQKPAALNNAAATAITNDTNGTVAAALPFVPDILNDKCAKRAFLERYQLGLIPASPPRPRQTPEEAMEDGLRFLLKLQDPFSGHWANDYSGCMFLLPGLVFVQYIVAEGDSRRLFPQCFTHQHMTATKQGSLHGDEPGVQGSTSKASGEDAQRVLGVPAAPGTTGGDGAEAVEETCHCGEATRQELIRFLRNYQNEDGGWGQHTEGHSTMLGTVLNYVTLRLLGVPASDPEATKARHWIQEHGGATTTPMWGRVWLSILGVYSWDGVYPIPPEMILLPDWVPFSLGKAWCHSRVIAIPFSYFYGLRWSATAYPTTLELRKELYTQSYSTIQWRRFRGVACERDVYTPLSPVVRCAMGIFELYERYPISFLRRYALERNWQHIAYDDENTHFICLGPVNKALNMLVTWVREGQQSARFHAHRDRVSDYLYMGRCGMSMSGYNGSQLWDTSFAVQAICACQHEMTYPMEVALAHHYVDVAQVREDPMAADIFYRHRTKGAWNFSTSQQGWQVSDCTAEGLRVILLLPQYSFSIRRIYDSVDEILSLRNSGIGGDGGWPTYEPSRGPAYCELFNCAELFKDVMIDYSYAECSSSCIHTLALFREQYPHYRRREVNRAIREGIVCVLGKQQPDGGFYGSWAVCYTYAAWLVADALRASKEVPDMEAYPPCVKLVDYLLGHQNDDGGWGEDINACVQQTWVDNPDGSQVVNTAWAVMAIICGSGKATRTETARRHRIRDAVERGIRFIMSRQLESGDWAQERISGIFNGNNPIHYPGYKNAMTVWALGKYNNWKGDYVVA